MLLNPNLARATLRKAGSTNVITYTEITLRMIPAIGLILAAPVSKYPTILPIFGWFMLITSFVLNFVPRTLHHNFSNKCADVLQLQYFMLKAPFAIAMDVFLLLGIY